MWETFGWFYGMLTFVGLFYAAVSFFNFLFFLRTII